MALSILDGNQTATTLSSVVTSGEHIVAHSVVSLGANAIANITSAVSGSVVSVSNLPSTQTIVGTVTANVVGQYFDSATGDTAQLVNPVYYDGEIRRVTPELPLPVTLRPDPGYGQTVVTISGTVTASLNENTIIEGGEERILGTSGGLTLSGGVGIAFNNGSASGVVGTNNPLPVSGTVTAAVPNGTLTTRFGTPTTASVAFATSCVTNANRKYLLIQNVTTASNVITVGIGFTPTTTQGIQLTAGAGITFESSYIPTGAVYVLSSVTASNFTILEA